jgi:hypothetical protein
LRAALAARCAAVSNATLPAIERSQIERSQTVSSSLEVPSASLPEALTAGTSALPQKASFLALPFDGSLKRGYRTAEGGHVANGRLTDCEGWSFDTAPNASMSSGRSRHCQNLLHAVAMNREGLLRQSSMSALELDLRKGFSTGATTPESNVNGATRPPLAVSPLPPTQGRPPLRVCKSLGLLSVKPVAAQYAAAMKPRPPAAHTMWAGTKCRALEFRAF